MERIESRINPQSAEFKRNREVMDEQIGRLRAEIDRIRLGGPENARKRHVERGKLLVRDRVKRLLAAWNQVQIANDLQAIPRVAFAQKP